MFLKCQTELTFVMYSRCIHTENSFSFTVLVGNVKKKTKTKTTICPKYSSHKDGISPFVKDYTVH